jgi:DNA processing protein
MGPERNNFLRRNRIIAGLSQATLVVESAKKGGALITANMAFSYDRDVMVVPGRVGDDRSQGCNNLIKRDMAAMIESAGDVIRHLNWDVAGAPETPAVPEVEPSTLEKRLLLSIEQTPGITPGTLSNLTGIPVNKVLALLLEMELKSWISAEPGNSYRTRINLS